MNEVRPVVYVVDDDVSMRSSLTRLIRSAGREVESFGSAQEFLETEHVDRPACVVLDIRMPGLSGLDLQDKMAEVGLDMPIVFITGHGNIPASVRAMKAGAVDFLEKPFEEETLLDAIKRALDRSRQSRQKRSEKETIEDRVKRLTSREYEVFTLVITGMLNKQIAGELGVSEKTVKVHRARVMRKMRVVSVAELVRLAEKVGITSASPPPL
jgi:RNA polymerase sigma factor (sigma-70 family)